jgi:hypothetical protein
MFVATKGWNFEVTVSKGFFVSADFRWLVSWNVEATVCRKDLGCENFGQITHSF